MEPDKTAIVKVEQDPEDDNEDDFVAGNFVDVNLIENEENISNDYSGENHINIKEEFITPDDPISTSTEENYSDNDSSSDDNCPSANVTGDKSSHNPLALGVPVNTEFSPNTREAHAVIEQVLLLERYKLAPEGRRGRPGRKPSGRTPEEKKELQRIRRREIRHSMSEEKRAIQRLKIRERVRKSRLMQSDEEKAYQKMMDRERKRRLRGCQTEEEREMERMKNRERMRRTRLLQTAEERAWENLKARERKRRMRAALRQEPLGPCDVTGLLSGSLFCEPSQLLEIEYREGNGELCNECTNI